MQHRFLMCGTGSVKSRQVGQIRIGGNKPTPDLLLHICNLFHQWGFGKTFGVPEIFY